MIITSRYNENCKLIRKLKMKFKLKRRRSPLSKLQQSLRPSTAKCIMGCFRKPVEKLSTWHECFLMTLVALSYFLLKYFVNVSLAPILGESPLSNPMIVLEPYMFLLFGLLLLQKFWKNGALGFVLAVAICLSTMCFLTLLFALMSLDSARMFEYSVIVLLPVSMFAIAVSMGKKYQNCLNC